MTERKRGTLITTKSGRLQGVITLALLLIGCDQGFSKTWDSGGKIEARVSAQTCPSVTVATERPLEVRVSCGDLSKHVYFALADMRVLTEGNATRPEHREAWNLACVRGDCSVHILELDSLAELHQVTAGTMFSREGRMSRRGAATAEIAFDGAEKGVLRLDSSLGVWTFEESFGGVTTKGAGKCRKTP
jgi:hypothetical protein